MWYPRAKTPGHNTEGHCQAVPVDLNVEFLIVSNCPTVLALTSDWERAILDTADTVTAASWLLQ